MSARASQRFRRGAEDDGGGAVAGSRYEEVVIVPAFRVEQAVFNAGQGIGEAARLAAIVHARQGVIEGSKGSLAITADVAVVHGLLRVADVSTMNSPPLFEGFSTWKVFPARLPVPLQVSPSLKLPTGWQEAHKPR